jgi:D-alanine-D-alanine ligase
LKAAILHGYVPDDAPQDEQDVLTQVEAVGKSLRKLGFSTTSVPFTLDLSRAEDTLASIGPALVFNLVESVEGRGRFIHLATTLLDAMRVPYTGSGNEAVFTTSSKTLAKSIMDMWAIPTPKSHTAESLRGMEPGRALSGRYIVKSVWEHGSIGIDESSVVEVSTASGLMDEILRRSDDFGQEFFAESYIEGREFNISIIESDGGPMLLPPAEMLFEGYAEGERRILDYASKWDSASSRYNGSRRTFEAADRDRKLIAEITDIATRCWRFFGLNGYARVDFRVDRLGRPWVLEVNVNPCISPDSGFVAATGQAGMSFDEAVHRIVNSALERSGSRKRNIILEKGA